MSNTCHSRLLARRARCLSTRKAELPLSVTRNGLRSSARPFPAGEEVPAGKVGRWLLVLEGFQHVEAGGSPGREGGGGDAGEDGHP